MGRARTSACALAVAMLAAGGCAAESDRGDGSPPDDVATQDGADQDSESPQQDDEAIAEAVLLTIDDFPSGWEAEPIDDDRADVSLDDDIGQCLGVDDDQREPDGAHASSPAFTSPTNEQVSASVWFSSSSDEARRAFEVLHAPDTPGCFADAFDAQARRDRPPEGVEVGEPMFDWLPFDRLGDDLVAIRGTLPATVGGVDLALHGGAVFTRVGRGVITITFSSALAPLDTDELRRLTGIAVERLAGADIGEAAPE
jgi:hypothetical protein